MTFTDAVAHAEKPQAPKLENQAHKNVDSNLHASAYGDMLNRFKMQSGQQANSFDAHLLTEDSKTRDGKGAAADSKTAKHANSDDQTKGITDKKSSLDDAVLREKSQASKPDSSQQANESIDQITKIIDQIKTQLNQQEKNSDSQQFVQVPQLDQNTLSPAEKTSGQKPGSRDQIQMNNDNQSSWNDLDKPQVSQLEKNQKQDQTFNWNDTVFHPDTQKQSRLDNNQRDDLSQSDDHFKAIIDQINKMQSDDRQNSFGTERYVSEPNEQQIKGSVLDRQNDQFEECADKRLQKTARGSENMQATEARAWHQAMQLLQSAPGELLKIGENSLFAGWQSGQKSGHKDLMVANDQTRKACEKQVASWEVAINELRKNGNRYMEVSILDPMSVDLHYVQEGLQDLRAGNGHFSSKAAEKQFNNAINDFIKKTELLLKADTKSNIDRMINSVSIENVISNLPIIGNFTKGIDFGRQHIRANDEGRKHAPVHNAAMKEMLAEKQDYSSLPGLSIDGANDFEVPCDEADSTKKTRLSPMPFSV